MIVARWGNSLAVRLPKKLVEDLGLKEGDEVELSKIGERQLAVAKADRRKAFIERMAQYKWEAPPGYKFDRDEANER